MREYEQRLAQLLETGRHFTVESEQSSPKFRHRMRTGEEFAVYQRLSIAYMDQDFGRRQAYQSACIHCGSSQGHD
jgi:hypothetical protein